MNTDEPQSTRDSVTSARWVCRYCGGTNRLEKKWCTTCGIDKAGETNEPEYVCPLCGRIYFSAKQSDCPACGEPVPDYDQMARSASATIVRSYAGRTQADAADLFAREAPRLAQVGYAPISQSWGDGRAGIARVLTLGLLANALRPDGFLTVTFARSQGQSMPSPKRATKMCPDCAEEVLVDARLCRFCRHEFAS